MNRFQSQFSAIGRILLLLTITISSLTTWLRAKRFKMKKIVGYTILTLLLLAVGVIIYTPIAPVAGLVLETIGWFLAGIGVFLFGVTPFMKDSLTFDPNKDKGLTIFYKIGDGKHGMIDQGGKLLYVINGNASQPKWSWFLFGLWNIYKWYVWKLYKLHVYFDHFTTPKTYELPRFKPDKEDPTGKTLKWTVDTTDHVRDHFTWWLELPGVEIEGVPFTVRVSIQAGIDKDKIYEAVYMTESWNVLLQQAAKSELRSVILREVTLDMAIGVTNKTLWGQSESKNSFTKIAETVLEALLVYTLTKIDGKTAPTALSGKTLANLGILIYSVDITDFADELKGDAKDDLHAPARGRQKGRAKDLEMQGEAKGAKAKVDALDDHPLAQEIIITEGRVAAAKAGGLGDVVSGLAKLLNKE